MVNYSNVYGNGNAVLVHELGSFKIIEHQRDLSVSPYSAVSEYFAAKMNLKRRQVMIELNNSGCIFRRERAMDQWKCKCKLRYIRCR